MANHLYDTYRRWLEENGAPIPGERRTGDAAERREAEREREIVREAYREAEASCSDCGFTVRNNTVAQGARWSEYDGKWLCPRCANELTPRERQIRDLMATRERQVAEHLEKEAFGVALSRELVAPLDVKLFGEEVYEILVDDCGDLCALAFAAWRVGRRAYNDLGLPDEMPEECLYAAEVIHGDKFLQQLAHDALSAVKERAASLDRADRRGFVLTKPAVPVMKRVIDKRLQQQGDPFGWRPPNA